MKWSATVLATHAQFIHARLQNVGGYTFDLTVVYGKNTAVKRRMLWSGINANRTSSSSKDWLLIGDFNEIRHPDEREGHGSFNRVGAGEFESAISGFTELEAIGGSFTWSNGVDAQHTKTRLDRALGNARWTARWPQTRPKLLLGTSSDHAALHLQLTRLEKGATSFKFYNTWLLDELFNNEFKAAWKFSMYGTSLYWLQMKIKAVRAAGKKWAELKRQASETPSKITAVLQAIATKLQLGPFNTAIQEEYKRPKAKLIETQHTELLNLQQRAHVNWITKGDQGSAFFAQAIRMRQTKNLIMSTIDVNGAQTNSLEEMNERTIAYFTNLYSATDRLPPIPNLNISYEIRPTIIENAKLRTIPSGEEIQTALKSLPTAKAPGIDGITAEMVKHHWSTMREDITAAILHFFNTRRMLRSLNLASLTLIPKIQNPERLEDYRPISCLGVIYKIFSKILTTRLMNILPTTINTNQTTFIRGRRISDAMGLAQEFTQGFNCRNTSRRACITIDFTKAFDTIRWDAIEVVMELMGIDATFKELVMACITINISISIRISLSRGLADRNNKIKKRPQAGRSTISAPVCDGAGLPLQVGKGGSAGEKN